MSTVDKSYKRPPWLGEPTAFKKAAWVVRLYNSQGWRKKAKAHIASQPYCVQCAANGIGTVDRLQADHINGFADEAEFWSGPLQTLCKACNMAKAGQRGRERQGRGVGVNP